MPGHRLAKVVTSSIGALCLIEGYYGLKYRDYTHDKRPLKYQSCVDPRIKPSTEEEPLLKAIRFLDIYAVKGVMQYLLTIRNQTHYFGVKNLRTALDRPDGVGLLTVSNHVTTIDSASLPCPNIHFRDLLNPRNCGYWNLAREDQTFETAPKAMICSLAKLMPIHRGGGVYQIALDNFIQRIKYGDWGHIFPEGRTYQEQLKSCRDEQGRRIRASGRTAPPGRDLGPMKWGVGRVIYEAAKQQEESSFVNGVNNGKIMILPFYHLNMEKVLPEDEDLKVISFIPGKKNDIYCMFGKPIDVSDIMEDSKKKLASCKTEEEKEQMMFVIYKELTDRVEMSLASLEYKLKALRQMDQE
ncbi:hypothetical protein WA171_007219 [Blastocystis sp. BT1]